MILHRGDIIGSDFGIGKITAITRFWVIHEIETGDEVAVHREEGFLYIPAEIEGEDVDASQDIDVEHYEQYFEYLDDLLEAIKKQYSHYYKIEQAEKDALAGKTNKKQCPIKNGLQ